MEQSKQDLLSYEILVIDDEQTILDAFTYAFRSQKVKVRTTTNGDIGLEILKANPRRFAAIYVDLHIGEQAGDKIAIQLREIDPNVSIFMMSGDNTESAIRAYLNARVDDYYKKPLDFFSKILPDALDAFNKYDKLQRVVSTPENGTSDFLLKTGLVGNSPAITEIAKYIQNLAPEDSNALIIGENGTGKEVVAKALHNCSGERRSSGPFVPVNCGAIPPETFESEMFGHVRGAFTGATHNTSGFVGEAKGGTLFLDEIGDLRLDLQVKILRLIENQEYRRVGESSIKKNSARIIAGTNVNLEQAVKDKHFREDLYFRLNVAPVHIPPLRERKEDIEPLFLHFKKLFERKYGVKVEVLKAVIDMLQEHDWPGNVRELRNVVERLYLRARMESLVMQPHFLESKFWGSKGVKSIHASGKSSRVKTIEEITKENELRSSKNIVFALHVAGGVTTIAADKLGVSESTLRSQIAKFKLKDLAKRIKRDSKPKTIFE